MGGSNTVPEKPHVAHFPPPVFMAGGDWVTTLMLTKTSNQHEYTAGSNSPAPFVCSFLI